MKKKRNAFSILGSWSAGMLPRAMICEKRTARPSGSTARPMRRLRLVSMIVRSLRAMVATFCQFIWATSLPCRCGLVGRPTLLAVLIITGEQPQVGLLQGGDRPADELDLAAGGDDRLYQPGVVPLRLADLDRDRVAADRDVRAAGAAGGRDDRVGDNRELDRRGVLGPRAA